MKTGQNVFSEFFRCAVLATLVIGAAGCSQPAAPPKVQDGAGHAGAGAGPHGGTLAEWEGGKYHVEVTVDHDKKEAVVYVLGRDEKTAAPVVTSDATLLLTIKEPTFQVQLIADPLDGETGVGVSSRYRRIHDNFGIVRKFSGTISGAVNGISYAGEFAQ